MRHVASPFGALLFFAAVTVPRPADAARTDILVLDNGDRITGEIVTLEKGKLSFTTDNIGTLSVEWVHVAELRSNNGFTVETRRGDLYFGSLAETEDGRLKVVDRNATSTTLDVDLVVRVFRVKDTSWSRIDGSLDIGYGYTQQNGSTQFNLNSSVY